MTTIEKVRARDASPRAILMAGNARRQLDSLDVPWGALDQLVFGSDPAEIALRKMRNARIELNKAIEELEEAVAEMKG